MDLEDCDGRGELLARIGGLSLDFADDVQAFGDPTEGGETLAIGVAFAAEIEGGLVAEANEEVGFGGVGVLVASHGEGAVLMVEAGDRGPFEGDGRVGGRLVVAASLDDFDFDRAVGLVVGLHGAMETPPVVLTGIDVTEEVGGGFGRVDGVDLRLDIPGVLSMTTATRPGWAKLMEASRVVTMSPNCRGME